MRFSTPLIRGRLLRRYKRFFADMMLEDGREITAHCPNPGAMLGMNAPGAACWLSHDANPKRKLAYTWELVEADGAMVVVNTLIPNRLAAEALAAGAIPELAAHTSVRREVAYGAGSRVDFLLEGGGPPAWVEVKGVTLRRAAGLAEWPDCVSARGARHAAELGEVAKLGARGVVLFTVLRGDCERFAVAADLDPAFAAALDQVRALGVEVIAYGCDVTPEAVTLRRPIPL